MKIKVVTIVLMVLLTLSLLGCLTEGNGGNGGSQQSLTGYAAKTTVEFYTCNDFTDNPKVTDEIEFTVGKGVTVILCSNASTGFEWGEEAEISDTTILELTGHKVKAATSDKPGAAGTETFTFVGRKAGTATVHLEYSQPWEGGEKAAWTCDLTIIVK